MPQQAGRAGDLDEWIVSMMPVLARSPARDACRRGGGRHGGRFVREPGTEVVNACAAYRSSPVSRYAQVSVATGARRIIARRCSTKLSGFTSRRAGCTDRGSSDRAPVVASEKKSGGRRAARRTRRGDGDRGSRKDRQGAADARAQWRGGRAPRPGWVGGVGAAPRRRRPPQRARSPLPGQGRGVKKNPPGEHRFVRIDATGRPRRARLRTRASPPLHSRGRLTCDVRGRSSSCATEIHAPNTPVERVQDLRAELEAVFPSAAAA